MSGFTEEIPISDFLHDTQGGAWRFDGKGTWYCDDDKRTVCLMDTKEYWLIYHDDRAPEKIL